ncbi:MAG: esterase-like activity of phytase family protein [Paracoccaceae bacterium]|nr:esterase-like activity of phytase family protein [Paracoccaceae bacterium]
MMVVAPVVAFSLMPPPPATAPRDQPAQHLSTFNWHQEGDWFGGFSGFEITEDGNAFFTITDRGSIVRGELIREGDAITGVEMMERQPLVDMEGQKRNFPHTDAEGLARDQQGRLFVSFEHAHRILRYDTWDSPAIWPSYTPEWRALVANTGLETVAVQADGTIFSISEGVEPDIHEALVYRRLPDEKWDQPFTLALEGGFVPVGGDFGPDEKLYVLERHFTPYGFQSQVRRMDVTANGFENTETILQTPVRQHGNIEGLAVWKDGGGKIRLTMISDDNFLPILPTDIIEYIVNE